MKCVVNKEILKHYKKLLNKSLLILDSLIESPTDKKLERYLSKQGIADSYLNLQIRYRRVNNIIKGERK